jgi:hypothetical protein
LQRVVLGRLRDGVEPRVYFSLHHAHRHMDILASFM